MAERKPLVLEVPVAEWDDKQPLSDLREHILTGLDKPVVFRARINSWNATNVWSPTQICKLLAKKQTVFKICPKRGGSIFQSRFKENEAIFETQCEHVEATFLDFSEWLHSSGVLSDECLTDSTSPSLHSDSHNVHCCEPSTKKVKLDEHDSTNTGGDSLTLCTNPLLLHPRAQYWIYADYKYMHQLCGDMPEMLSAIDWNVFGFQGRDGKDTTLWVGSEGACTPCHYDTYGCNLVAQLWGRKKWVLFSPGESKRLYPTRIPYEESSVFSSVCISSPNLLRYPEFADSTAYEVVLSPGEVLFVPRHWWHYVECVDPAVSVNTWIELPSDGHERVKEAVVRTLVAAFVTQAQESGERDWINPNEVSFSTEENLHFLTLALREERGEHSALGHLSPDEQLTSKDFVRALASKTVVESIAQCLLDKM